MPTIDEMYGALRSADAAGDTNAAQRIATSIKAMRAKPAVAPEKEEAGVMSRIQAGAAGINKGFYADLLGLPADTIANVIDLGKAGAGSAYQAISGNTAPDALLPYDRRDVPLTSEWIQKGLHSIGMGGAIDNPHPEDQASRIIHMGGRVGGASFVPSPRAAITVQQNLANVAKGAAGGIAAGSVGEVAPGWAGLAGMTPSAAIAAGSAGMRGLARGGEAGRLAMVQRIQDLKDGGVNFPSVGLASGNKGIMGLENLLSQTPGSVGMYDAARARNIDDGMKGGIKAKSDSIRDRASMVRGNAEAGSAIQSDLKNLFKERINSTYEKLNDKFAGKVQRDIRFPIDGTLSALDATTAINPMAPRTTASFVQPRIAGLRENILADTTETVPGTYYNSTRNTGLPLNATKDVRTDIGKEAASRAIFGTPEQADFKRLYAGLSEDMKTSAKMTDMDVGPQPNNIGPAQKSLARANNFYSKGMDRAGDMASLANNATPEGAFKSIANSLKSGGTMYSKLRNAVSPETRGKIVATVIDDMGMATPGNQNAAGDVWSPRTFLTNYNRIDTNGRKELFKRVNGGESMADNLAKVAKTAEMLGDSSKVWANPSGTSPALVARGTLATIGAGAFGGLFYTPLIAPAATAAGGLLLANQVSKRLLLNPQFVGWLAKAPSVPRAQQQAYAQRLIANARMTNDKQFSQDVGEYVKSLGQAEQGDDKE